MKLRSTRICKPRAPLQLQLDSHQNISATRRRSSRLQSNQHILGSYYESQSPVEQRPADPQTSQSVGATSNTCVPTLGPVEAPAPVPSRAQFQEYLCPPQTPKTVQQPKPLPLKRPHASFLEDSANQLPSSPAPKRYRPESVVTQWIESISGSESYRERYCRSDTLLGYSNSELIPRRLTKSAPNMEYIRDADGFVMPPTPTSWCPPSVALSNTSGASTGSSRKKSLVEDPSYRRMNLGENNIYMRSSREQFPDHIANLVDHIYKDRDSPGPSSDQIWQDMSLENLEMGTGEPDVEDYFKNKIFDKPEPLSNLKRIDKNPMAKYNVPNIGSKLKVSIPVPDMLYGYNSIEAFPLPQQQAQLRSMGNEIIANSQDLIYPFFVIEFKADGPGGSGSLWVATNQCLGGSVSCVNIAERLNRQLRQCKSDKVQPIDSAAFSIAMSGTEARLYISWKHNELDYYMRKVKSFSLQEPEQYVEFRKHVRNIIDWGKDKRLKEIRKSLDSLLEEDRKVAFQLAKSRPPPSDDSASSSSHKRKDSSSRGRNSRAKIVHEYPSGEANAPPSASFQENNQDESFVAPSLPVETADSTDYDYDGEDPTNQLLTEYWTSFSANN
ncbi:hypothetical protein EAF04_008114 [Stromatinia cepivora]|nr:hypothetical protein EAF04_008114 [Stromatinia cepivora]